MRLQIVMSIVRTGLGAKYDSHTHFLFCFLFGRISSSINGANVCSHINISTTSILDQICSSFAFKSLLVVLSIKDQNKLAKIPMLCKMQNIIEVNSNIGLYSFVSCLVESLNLLTDGPSSPANPPAREAPTTSSGSPALIIPLC